MEEPLINGPGDNGEFVVRQGPPLNVGQVRVDPNYPDQRVTVSGRYTESHWRINYAAGGFAVLREETIRAIYSEVVALEEEG